MKEETRTIKVASHEAKVQLLILEQSDREFLKRLYTTWLALNEGMKKFKSRGINIPEGISESAFCLCFDNNCARAIKISKGSGSFDLLNLKTAKRIQVKAVSVDNDLTSFGPKSVWDEIYLLDFYCEGKNDGSFYVYLIPNKLIYSKKVNATQTFKDQQAQGRRPRFSLKGLIKENNLKPLKKCKI